MRKNFPTQQIPLGVRISMGFMLMLLLVSIMAPFLTGERPIILQHEEDVYFFPDQSSGEYKSEAIRKILPVIPVSEKNIDLKRRLLPPLSVSGKDQNQIRHWAGTDHLGRDVAAGLIGGIWYALAIGSGVMLLSFILGITLGAASGWYGDSGIKWSPAGTLLRIITLIIILIWFFHWMGLYNMKVIPASGILVMVCCALFSIFIIFNFINKAEQKRQMKAMWISIPIDAAISRIIEWLTAIPALLIILALTSLFKEQNIWTMIGLISLLTWPLSARLVRSEVLRRNYQPYMQQLRHQKTPFLKVLIRDLMPNISTPLITVFAFGFAGVIMLDATLSFLNLGLPLEEVNWGNQIGGIRRHPEAWWLAAFPGVMIAGILISLNIIGNWLQDKAGAKGRQLKWY